ncbi:hypothetical protein TNCV_1438671 [Trichonephila clavipes]|nr:hypothetical protein TNCV_1438671 [Trichonephila clavipes]
MCYLQDYFPEELRDDSLWWHGPELLYRVLIQPLSFQNQPREMTLTAQTKGIQGEKKGPLTTKEVKDAEPWLIKQDQRGINLSDPSGNLKFLNIFQDDKGVLRVGGRLEKASIPYNQSLQLYWLKILN